MTCYQPVGQPAVLSHVPPPLPCPQVEASSAQQQYCIRSSWHLVSIWTDWPVYVRVHLVPAAAVIPAPWVDSKVVAVKNLICYCLQFSFDHLYVTLVIMIQLGSIFQIPLCIIHVTEMEQPGCLSYTASNDEYIVHEQITQVDLPPGIETKISNVPFDSAIWHTDNYKQDTSATSCKIFQTLYLCLTWEL